MVEQAQRNGEAKRRGSGGSINCGIQGATLSFLYHEMMCSLDPVEVWQLTSRDVGDTYIQRFAAVIVSRA